MEAQGSDKKEFLRLVPLEPSPHRFLAESSDKRPSAQYLRPNLQLIYQLGKGFRFCLTPPAPLARSGNWACGPRLGEHRTRAGGATGERRAENPMPPVQRSDTRSPRREPDAALLL